MENFYVSYSYACYDRDTGTYQRKDDWEFVKDISARRAARSMEARCRAIKGFLGFEIKIVYTEREAARLGIVYSK